jgi:hypothetical protein
MYSRVCELRGQNQLHASLLFDEAFLSFVFAAHEMATQSDHHRTLSISISKTASGLYCLSLLRYRFLKR